MSVTWFKLRKTPRIRTKGEGENKTKATKRPGCRAHKPREKRRRRRHCSPPRSSPARAHERSQCEPARRKPAHLNPVHCARLCDIMRLSLPVEAQEALGALSAGQTLVRTLLLRSSWFCQSALVLYAPPGERKHLLPNCAGSFPWRLRPCQRALFKPTGELCGFRAFCWPFWTEITPPGLITGPGRGPIASCEGHCPTVKPLDSVP